jgi:hypothetical protein
MQYCNVPQTCKAGHMQSWSITVMVCSTSGCKRILTSDGKIICDYMLQIVYIGHNADPFVVFWMQ